MGMLTAGASLLVCFTLAQATLGQESAVRETKWPGGAPRERFEVALGADGQEIRQGKYESWSEGGERTSKGEYENGKRNGAWKFFFATGKKRSNGRFEEGLRHGKWRLYHDNGKLRGQGKFRDDFMRGEWSFRTTSGKDDPTESGDYRHLQLNYADGTLRGRGYLKDERLHGDWVYYWEDGTVQYAGRYVEGLREGPWIFQHGDGTYDEEMLSGVYAAGKRVKSAPSSDLPGFAQPLKRSDVNAAVEEASDRGELDRLLDLASKGRGAEKKDAIEKLVSMPIRTVPAVIDWLQTEERGNPRLLERAAGSFGNLLATICGGAAYPFQGPTGEVTPESIAFATKRWASLWALTGPNSDFWVLDAALMESGSPDALYHPPFPELDRGMVRWFSSPSARALYSQRFDKPEDQPAARSVEVALEWLSSQQSDDGGWDADGFSEDETIQGIERMAYHDVGVTALSLLAFMAAGNNTLEGPYRENVGRGLVWLARQLNRDGSIESRLPETELSYDQAIAALCLCEAAAQSPSPGLARMARATIDWILKARSKKAGWYYGSKPTGETTTSLTAWMVQALFAARRANIGADSAKIDTALEGARLWVVSVSERRTGRVGYKDRNTHSLRMEQNQHYPRDRAETMTAAGLFCHALFGTDPKTEIIPRHIYRIRKAPPLWSSDGLGCDMYYWYFATNALFQFGGDPWMKWWKKWSSLAVHAQKKKGDARGSWEPVGPWGFVGGRVYSTAIMALGLTTPQRFSRLEKKRGGSTAGAAKRGKGKKRG